VLPEVVSAGAGVAGSCLGSPGGGWHIVRVVGGQCDGDLFFDGRIADAGLGAALVAELYADICGTAGGAHQWHPCPYLVMEDLYITEELIVLDLTVRGLDRACGDALTVADLYAEFVAIEIVAFRNDQAYYQQGR